MSIPAPAPLGLPGSDLKGDSHEVDTEIRDGAIGGRVCRRAGRPRGRRAVGRQPGDAQGRGRAAVPRPGDQQEPACVANRKVLLIEVAPERGPIDYADNRTNGKGKWVFSSQLQGATVVQAKVGESKASGVTCRSALSPAKAL